MIDDYNLKDGDKILDVGSGNGYIAYNLSNNVKQIVCIDNDKSIIRNAKKKFERKNIQFICDDIKNLHKYNHRKFDLSHVKALKAKKYVEKITV